MPTDDPGAAMGPPPVPPNRQFLEALLHLARTGAAWRDLPAEFGTWAAVDHRFRRWVASGGLRRPSGGMTAGPQFGDVRRVLVDSTIARAHQPAARPRRQAGRSGRPGRRRATPSAAAAG